MPCLQEKLAALAGPQEEAYVRAQQLERALKEKAGQLSTAAKQVGGGGEWRQAVPGPCLLLPRRCQVQEGLCCGPTSTILHCLFLPHPQAAAALAAKEDAQQAGRRERLRREAAEQRAQQLAEQLNQATLQLRAASGAAAVRAEQQVAEAAAKREQQAADAAAR